MVCLGPRKKEKKNANFLSPDDATTTGTTRGLKKSSTSKLSIKSNKKEPTPSIKKPSVSRNSLEKTNTGIPRPSSRNSLLSNGGNTTTKQTSSAARSKSPIPKTNGTSRPSSMISVKSVGSTRNGTQTTSATSTARTSRTPSTASSTAVGGAPGTTTKRFPITEMKEEVKDLKAKNEENLKLIADQAAELERLKQQLQQVPVSPPADQLVHPEVVVDEETMEKLKKEQQEQLELREKEIEQLRIQLEEQKNVVPTIVVQKDPEEEEKMQEILAQKEKELEEKEALLQEQKRLMDEKVPEIEQVAMQLEALKTQNLTAVEQLASKEKELEELRSLIKEKPTDDENLKTEEDKQQALLKIEELNKQLEAQKKSHEESLRLHEEALAEKDNLLKEQKVALEALQDNHSEEVRKLKTAQSGSILALKKKHKQDREQLEKELEEAKKEAERNPNAAIDLDEHMERILAEFEQAEHTHAIEVLNLEQSHQSELNNLENDQKAQVNKLKRTHNLNRDSWTERYLPTDAVSWPLPNGSALPKLKPTPSPLMESKSKTLLRVLGNMPGYQKPEPVLTPLDPKKVQIYYSSVSGNTVIKRNQEQIQQLLNTNKIKFTLVDVAQSEAARQYAKKANNNGKSEGRIKEFPQVYVGGEYRGQYNDLVQAIDDNQLEEFLHAAAERQFTAEERAAIQKAEMDYEENSARAAAMPAVPALPVLRPTKSTNAKPVKTLKDYDEDEELLKALEKELDVGNINLDDF